jgi:hypothetical protein
VQCLSDTDCDDNDACTTATCNSNTCQTTQICIDFPDGFNCENLPFTLNGNAVAAREEAADPVCFLRLVSDNPRLVGSAFLPFEFSSSNTNLDFKMSIGYRIFGNEYGTADGMTFVIHADSRGVHALGGAGAGIGWYNNGQILFGGVTIKNALIIEWDTYPNPDVFDNGENNIHILGTTSTGEPYEIAEETFGSEAETIRTNPDGTPGKIWVESCGKLLNVYFNKDGDTKPAAPSISVTIDLFSILGTRSAFAGYTSGTGGQGDNHDITSFQMCASQ